MTVRGAPLSLPWKTGSGRTLSIATVGGIITASAKRVTVRSEGRSKFQLFRVSGVVTVDSITEFPCTSLDPRSVKFRRGVGATLLGILRSSTGEGTC